MTTHSATSHELAAAVLGLCASACGGEAVVDGSEAQTKHGVVIGQDPVTIVHSSLPLTCENPNASTTACDWWRLTIAMPRGGLTDGAIDLASVSCRAAGFTPEQSGSPSSCASWGTTEGVCSGTLTLAQTERDWLAVRLEDVLSPDGIGPPIPVNAIPNGDYRAFLCR